MGEPVQKIAGIVLAAGASSRMGRPKQLLPVRGKPLLACVVEEALCSDLDRVVLVLGHRSGEIRNALGAAIDHPKLRVVDNRRYREGISTSILSGLLVAEMFDHVMILLGDMPCVDRHLINHLMRIYLESGLPLGAVQVQNRRSLPVIFSRACYPDLRRLSGDEGARRLFETYAGRVCLVQPDRSYTDRDIDTPEDYRRYRRELEPGETGS